MPTFLNVSYFDRAKQRAGVSFRTRDMSAANIDAIQDEFSDLRAALEPFTLGNLIQYELVADRVFVSNGAAASTVARRELKLLLSYEDTVSHVIYQHEIPAPELTNAALWVDEAKRTFVVKTTAEWIALKAAFEATVRSPEGNSVTLQNGEIVGRNL